LAYGCSAPIRILNEAGKELDDLAMPRRHALFCNIDPDQRGHGLFCVSRSVARQAEASSEAGSAVAVTVDLAVRWADPAGLRLVRLVGGSTADRPFIALMASGVARQLAAALLVAAGQAEELERDVTRPHPVR
jgi:hypothetical protein